MLAAQFIGPRRGPLYPCMDIMPSLYPVSDNNYMLVNVLPVPRVDPASGTRPSTVNLESGMWKVAAPPAPTPQRASTPIRAAARSRGRPLPPLHTHTRLLGCLLGGGGRASRWAAAIGQQLLGSSCWQLLGRASRGGRLAVGGHKPRRTAPPAPPRAPRRAPPRSARAVSWGRRRLSPRGALVGAGAARRARTGRCAAAAESQRLRLRCDPLQHPTVDPARSVPPESAADIKLYIK